MLLRAEAELFQPTPAPPRPSGRTGRAGAGSINLFSQSSHATAWSAYDLSRLGSRHEQVRPETYTQVKERADELETREELMKKEAEKNRQLNSELDSYLDVQELSDDQRAAADCLQQAAIELLDDDVREEADVRVQLSCKDGGVRLRWSVFVSLGSNDDPDDDGELDGRHLTPSQTRPPPSAPASAAATPACMPIEIPPSAFVQNVTYLLRGRPTVGILALYSEQGLVAWCEPRVAQSWTAIPLTDVSSCKLQAARATPFSPVQQSLVLDRKDGSQLIFYGPPSGLLQMEELRTLLTAALTALPPSVSASASITSNEAGTAASSQSPRLPVMLTARVKAGRALREQLQHVARLRAAYKTAQADEATAALAAANTDADASSQRKLDSLSKRRATELRDELFSYGSMNLTQKVLIRFLDMPEVREVLPAELRKKHADSKSHEVRQKLIETAKSFIARVYKSAGRRTDINRNAMAAGLAQMLPPDLFTSRQGRAACRELGISYRQAKRGSQLNRESLDWGAGWREIRSGEHYDKVGYGPVRDAWHDPLLSEVDNQNKELIRVDVGLDPKTGERVYEWHPRRAQQASTKALLPIFRSSTFAQQLSEQTKTRKRPNGVKLGARQFALAKCPCVKKRKASECDCPECTYVDRNLAVVHAARSGWLRGVRQRVGGALCDCHIHRWPRVARASAQVADALQAIEEGWRAAAEEGGAEAAEQWVGAVAESEQARAEAEAAATKAAKARRYDEMTRSRKMLTDVLMEPCGKQNYPDYSIIGGGEFHAYKKRCISNDCDKRIFKGREACGWDRVIGTMCPVEDSEDPFSWFVWEKQLRGTNEDGKPFYSLEWCPKHGTRKQFWAEFRSAVTSNLLHVWRDEMMSQGRRVLADRRSGHHVDALLERKRACEAAAALPTLRARAFIQAATHAEVRAPQAAAEARASQVAAGATDTVAAAAASAAAWCWQPLTLRACSQLMARVANPSVQSKHEASRLHAEALEVHVALARTAVKQSDYAAQIETRREFTATCAIRERHNCLVTVVGFKPYAERRARPPRKRRPRKVATYEPPSEPRGPLFIPSTRAVHKPPPPPPTAAHETDVYKQNVSVFYAMHNAGFKPSARSYNVAQEDIDHILKYGTAIHGEWFLNGQRLPGGDHRKPLPRGLSDAPSFKPPFPEMSAVINFTDGCPNQFDYGTNYHQAAVWFAKTATWARDHAKVRRAEAAEALKSKQVALHSAAAGTPEKEAAEKAMAIACSHANSVDAITKAIIDSDGLSEAIKRTDVILIEHHGKGACDAQASVPKFAIAEAITTGQMIDPDTRHLVLHMAEHKQTPSIAKANKAGWEAPQDYYYGFFETAKFTKRAVPDATGFKHCARGHHQFSGACQDLELAERNGPLQVAGSHHVSCMQRLSPWQI